MRTYYYTDPLTDDFAGTHIRRLPLKKSFRYIHTAPLWLAAEAFLYRAVAQPLVFCFTRLHYHQRFADRSALKAAGAGGLYLYGNHTNALLDAFCPNIVSYRRRAHIIAGPDTMSLPGLRNFLQMMGVIPIGDTMRHKLEMEDCVLSRAASGRVVAVYPEAHIWPYYTGIRPFPDASFRFPARDGLPAYAMTNCYSRRRFGKRPRVTTFVDGPFFAPDGMKEHEKRAFLCAACYNAMRERAENYSTYSYNRFVPADGGERG